MERSIHRQIRVIVTMGVVMSASAACSDDVSSNPAGSLDPRAARDGWSIDESEARSASWRAQGTDFHTAIHPPHWTRWTTDGASAIESDAGFLIQGLRCSGSYCDDVGLLEVESGHTQTNS